MLQLFKNLLLFGEGGDGGAGAAPDGAPEGQTAGQPGVTVPDAGEQRPKRLTKEERRARFEQQLAAEQAQAQQPQTAEAPAAKTPDEEFQELIKGKLKEPYGKAVETAIKGRFKGVKETEARLKDAEEMLAQLVGNKYGIKPGEDGRLDLKAVRDTMSQDDDLYEERAMELGVSTTTARHIDEMEKKLAAMEAEQKTREDISRVQNIRNQAERARQDFPDLDIDKEMENPIFHRMVWESNVPVLSAYKVIHEQEIAARQMKYAVDTTRAAAAATIQAGMARPSEGGLGRSAPANLTRITDPRLLTREQRKDIRRRVARGEKVTWE